MDYWASYCRGMSFDCQLGSEFFEVSAFQCS